MDIKQLNERLEQLLNEDKKTYYIYAGYYEIYITDHELSAPYMYQAENTNLNDLLNDNISVIDENGEWLNPDAAFATDTTIIIDKTLIPEIFNTDLFEGYDEDTLKNDTIADLSAYYV